MYLAGMKVQEADLIPQQAAKVTFKGACVCIGSISVQTSALDKSNQGSNERSLSSRYLSAALRDLVDLSGRQLEAEGRDKTYQVNGKRLHGL